MADHDSIQSKKINQLQLELLEMFSQRRFSEQELIDIKKMISDYYFERADREIDQLFEEQKWDVPEKVKHWGQAHYRKKSTS